MQGWVVEHLHVYVVFGLPVTLMIKPISPDPEKHVDGPATFSPPALNPAALKGKLEGARCPRRRTKCCER